MLPYGMALDGHRAAHRMFDVRVLCQHFSSPARIDFRPRKVRLIKRGASVRGEQLTQIPFRTQAP
jgi:hypothetical protein